MNKVEKEHDAEEIKIRTDVDPGQKYLLLDITTDERWIVSIHDNYKVGQKAEDYDVYYDVISTNTDKEIKDSDGHHCLDTFIDEKSVFLIELDKEEPDVKSEEIDELAEKTKTLVTG